MASAPNTWLIFRTTKVMSPREKVWDFPKPRWWRKAILSTTLCATPETQFSISVSFDERIEKFFLTVEMTILKKFRRYICIVETYSWNIVFCVWFHSACAWFHSFLWKEFFQNSYFFKILCGILGNIFPRILTVRNSLRVLDIFLI